MAIDSGPFGGVVLTGEDARAFVRWIESDEPPPQAAIDAMRRGKELVRQFNETGSVSFTIHCKD
ncbi:hypothetical protein UFOVP1193_33 [uncultured Caudovirales phage]|uniref:Uncharacterized protein n=1 Tax=uncultured Caudovirales phage TaxID=2100421 RepID=A0A6J5R099_9CAUD|nr:hypothetical protein UFOVP1193_33 [uncultured Caudovirales phage]